MLPRAADVGRGTATVTVSRPDDDARSSALLVDPFSSVAPFLDGSTKERPALPIVGGLRTGGGEAGKGVLRPTAAYADGAVGVVVSGRRRKSFAGLRNARPSPSLPERSGT